MYQHLNSVSNTYNYTLQQPVVDDFYRESDPQMKYILMVQIVKQHQWNQWSYADWKIGPGIIDDKTTKPQFTSILESQAHNSNHWYMHIWEWIGKK